MITSNLFYVRTTKEGLPQLRISTNCRCYAAPYMQSQFCPPSSPQHQVHNFLKKRCSATAYLQSLFFQQFFEEVWLLICISALLQLVAELRTKKSCGSSIADWIQTWLTCVSPILKVRDCISAAFFCPYFRNRSVRPQYCVNTGSNCICPPLTNDEGQRWDHCRNETDSLTLYECNMLASF